MLGMLLALMLAVPAQQVEFKPRADVGSEVRVEIHSYLEFDLMSSDREGRHQRTIRTRLDETYLQTIKKVKNKRATLMTLVCERSTTEREGSNLRASGLVKTDRHGRRITVSREGTDHTVTIEGIPAKSDAAYIGRWEDIAQLLPSGAVSVGDKWRREFSSLTFLTAGGANTDANGTLSCTLSKVENQTATVHFEGTLTSAPSETETSTLKVEGDLEFNLDAGRPVSLTLTGSLSIDRTVIDEEYRPEEDEIYFINVGTIELRSKSWSAGIKFSAPD